MKPVVHCLAMIALLCGGQAFAVPADPALARSLGLQPDSTGQTSAPWNSRQTDFLDYLSGAQGEEERQVIAVQRAPDGTLRRIAVTTGEQEGGIPEVLAIGFANADRDPARELIVILAWHIQHYDVAGTLYDVRLFDDAKPGQTALTPLTTVAKRFGSYGCDCNRRDEPSETYAFKTIAAVKAELKRAGF